MSRGSKQNTEAEKSLNAHAENPKICANYRNTPPHVAMETEINRCIGSRVHVRELCSHKLGRFLAIVDNIDT